MKNLMFLVAFVVSITTIACGSNLSDYGSGEVNIPEVIDGDVVNEIDGDEEAVEIDEVVDGDNVENETEVEAEMENEVEKEVEDDSEQQFELPCDDHNPCTEDLREDGSCVYKDLVNIPCDDGNVCTINTICLHGGICGSITEEYIDCDDQNLCTADYCDQNIGCINESYADGHECGEESFCHDSICLPYVQWPQPGYDGTGQSPWSSGFELSVKWQILDVGKVQTSPVIGFAGDVYSAYKSLTESNTGELFAFSVDGENLWSTSVAAYGSYTDQPLVGMTNNNVYISLPYGVPIEFSSEDGEDMGEVIEDSVVYESRNYCFDNEGNMYLAAGNGNLYAIDSERNSLWVKRVATVNSNSLSNAPTYCDGFLYLVFLDELYKFDAETGNVIWHKTMTEGYGRTPVVKDGSIFISGVEKIEKYSAETGNLEGTWNCVNNSPVSSYVVTPTIGDDGLIYFAHNLKMYILNNDLTVAVPEYDIPITSLAKGGLRDTSRVIRSRNGLLFVSAGISLCIFNADTESNCLELDGIPSEVAMNSEGVVFVTTSENSLYAIDTY